MTNPKDFTGTDLPLAIGTVVGVRVFNLDSTKGSLVGPVYSQEWVPGENVAVCHETGTTWDYAGHCYAPVPAHKVGALSCKCGFYSYADDSNIEYYNESNRYKWRGMLGIIEGWGRVSYGRRGYRCSHARILALVEPARIDKPKDRPCEPVTGECARDVWPLIRHKYAEIPYYHTLLEALMDHPLRGIDNQEVA